VRLLPDAAHQANFTYLQFSRQMLRGIVLDAKGDRNARSFWIELLPGAACAPASGRRSSLRWPCMRSAITRSPAFSSPALAYPHARDPRDPARQCRRCRVLLRQQAQAAGVPAHEREVALFTLLYKEATRGSHRDFVNDTRLVPAGAPSDANFYDLLSAEHPPTAIFTAGARRWATMAARRIRADPVAAGGQSRRRQGDALRRRVHAGERL
jgi:hypothetical protein